MRGNSRSQTKSTGSGKIPDHLLLNVQSVPAGRGNSDLSFGICQCGMAQMMVAQAVSIEKLLQTLAQAQERIQELEQKNMELVRQFPDHLRTKSKGSYDQRNASISAKPMSASGRSDRQIREFRKDRLKSYDQPKHDSSEKLMSRSNSFQRNMQQHMQPISHTNPSLSNLNYQNALDHQSQQAPLSTRRTNRNQISITEQNLIMDDFDVMMYQDTGFRGAPRSFNYMQPPSPVGKRESRMKTLSGMQSVVAPDTPIPDMNMSISPQRKTISIKEVLSMSQPLLKPFDFDVWKQESYLQSPQASPQIIPLGDGLRNNHQQLSSGRYVLEKIREDLAQEVSNPTSGRRRSTQVEIHTRNSLLGPDPEMFIQEQGARSTNKQSVDRDRHKGSSRPTVHSKKQSRSSRQGTNRHLLEFTQERDSLKRNTVVFKQSVPTPEEECLISSSANYDIKIALRNYGNITGMLSKKKEAAKQYALSLISEIAATTQTRKQRVHRDENVLVPTEPQKKLKVDPSLRTPKPFGTERTGVPPRTPQGEQPHKQYLYTPSTRQQKCLSQRSPEAPSEGGGISQKAQVTEGSYFASVERSRIRLDEKNIKLSDEGQSKQRYSHFEAERHSPTTLQPSYGGDNHWNKQFTWEHPQRVDRRHLPKGSQREVFSTYM